MRVKNIRNERQSIYMQLFSESKKKLNGATAKATIALVFALIGLLFTGIFQLVFSLLSLLTSGDEMVSRVRKTIKAGKFDDCVFILLAVLIPFCLGQFALSATAMAVYKLSNVLLRRLSGNLGMQMKEAADVLPETANLIDDAFNIRTVSTASLVRGMRVFVKQNETVPADCVILDGAAEFDTSNVYLSKQTVSLSVGDKVLAGFVNKGASVTCEVIADSNLSLVCDLKEVASIGEHKNKKVKKRFVTISKIYPPAVLLLAVIMILVGGFTSGEWVEVMKRVSVLLVVATTGSYVFAAPTLTACAVWNLKRKGLALANGDSIEDLAEINCVVFEKEGILTDGDYKLRGIYTTEGISEEDFFMIAGNCIGDRNHPISQLLTPYMNRYVPVTNVLEFPGEGLECTMMKKTFLCGSESFMKKSGVDIGTHKDYTLYVSIDGKFIGAMLVQDFLREGTSGPVHLLRKTGVEKLVMFSSDRREVAEPAYLDCGADEFYCNLTPFERTEIIKEMKKDENIVCAYIGDLEKGANAMEEADIGITVVDPNYGEIEYADALLLGDMNTLAEAIETARVAYGKLELHFYSATAVKIILVLLSMFGAINTAVAILLDACLAGAALISAKNMMKK